MAQRSAGLLPLQSSAGGLAGDQRRSVAGATPGAAAEGTHRAPPTRSWRELESGYKILPLLVQEPPTSTITARLAEDTDMAVWWVTAECASALARLECDGASAAVIEAAFGRLDTLASAWAEVEPHDEIREIARRLLRVHPLRSADALQPAAATLLADRRPSTLTFVSQDERLRTAAAKEGFRVIGG